ncbi:hypothetical protein NFJ02_16g24720 [Pycnococcus provasolii]
MHQYSGSAAVVDAVKALVPGGTGYSAYMRRVRRAPAINVSVENHGRLAMVEFDNAARGTYKGHHHARLTRVHNVPVVAARRLRFFPDECSSELDQNDASEGPMSWKAYGECACDLKILESAAAIRNVMNHIFGEQHDAAQKWRKSVASSSGAASAGGDGAASAGGDGAASAGGDGSALVGGAAGGEQRVPLIIVECGDGNDDDDARLELHEAADEPDEAAGEQPVEAAGEPESAKAIRVCPRCFERYDAKKIKCNLCTLAGVKDSRLRAEASDPTLQEAQFDVRAAKVPRRDLTRGAQTEDEPTAGVRISGGIKLHNHVLEVATANPVGKNSAIILKDLLKIVKVQGVSEERDARRQWVFASMDVGARPPTDEDAVIDDHVVYLHPGGHEEAVYIRSLSRIVHMSTGGLLAESIGFTSPKAQAAMRDATDLHKSFDFVVNIAFPSLMQALIVECMIYTGSEEVTVEAFHSFLTGHPQDLTFTFFGKLVVRELPALAAYRAGFRTNKGSLVMRARRVLLPVLFARGHDKYGPSVLRDVIDIDERYSARLKSFRMKYFSDGGEGYDYRLEEFVKRLKSLVGNDSLEDANHNQPSFTVGEYVNFPRLTASRHGRR